MNRILALSMAAAMATAAPALAQTPGYFGAPTGANTPGSQGPSEAYPQFGAPAGNSGYSSGWNNGAAGYGYGYGYGAPGWNDASNGLGYNGYGVPNPSGALVEGRAAADDEIVPASRRHMRRHRIADDVDMNR